MAYCVFGQVFPHPALLYCRIRNYSVAPVNSRTRVVIIFTTCLLGGLGIISSLRWMQVQMQFTLRPTRHWSERGSSRTPATCWRFFPWHCGGSAGGAEWITASQSLGMARRQGRGGERAVALGAGWVDHRHFKMVSSGFQETQQAPCEYRLANKEQRNILHVWEPLSK